MHKATYDDTVNRTNPRARFRPRRALLAISRAIAFTTLACTLPAYAQQSEIEQAQKLLETGNASAAYGLLARREFEHAGNVDFDYLLGVAALHAGHPDKATLALERVLAIQPSFVGARVDMARAYFAMGDMIRARTEFETVRSQDPPPAARTTIDRYLAAIEERTRDQRTRVSAYLEAALGRDSNVNNASAQSQVYVPLFDVTFTLSASGLETAASYAAGGAGGVIEHRLDDRFTFFAGADARHRMHDRARSFDNTNVDTRAGLQYVAGAHTVRGALTYNHYRLDDTSNRSTPGFTLEYQQRLNLVHQVSAYAAHNRTRYRDSLLESNNADLNLAGIGWLANLRSVQLGLTVFGGYENETELRVDGDRRLYGARMNAQTPLAANVDAYVSAGTQRGHYRTPNVVFSTTRRDETYDLAIGANWRFLPSWSLRPVLAWVRNDSNLSINDYDRYDLSLTLRRDF